MSTTTHCNTLQHNSNTLNAYYSRRLVFLPVEQWGDSQATQGAHGPPRRTVRVMSVAPCCSLLQLVAASIAACYRVGRQLPVVSSRAWHVSFICVCAYICMYVPCRIHMCVVQCVAVCCSADFSTCRHVEKYVPGATYQYVSWCLNLQTHAAVCCSVLQRVCEREREIVAASCVWLIRVLQSVLHCVAASWAWLIRLCDMSWLMQSRHVKHMNEFLCGSFSAKEPYN